MSLVALKRAVRPAATLCGRRAIPARNFAAGGHEIESEDHQEYAYVNPKWFEGLEEGIPVEHPLKMGLLFPPKFTGKNAPTAEEYSSGTVKVPIVVDSLEWTLSSPPPLHQFDEPPIIVEFPEEDH
ncbi:hypothetical protein NSK_006305 [Nannochloropsis salina CCMP1776]|uniref:Uncharacterized protein n=1 Tax=Nannochloropsis salina CCMP1776 TaxID=1027361 RepID=A0A4D9CUY8_9STRA|nr:hypothetical protein NSK_006305 [Nannochloropsis salina CCMP1776]|eukprot:TFJ82394.1 hypothetical protein NSK_006305 [Nannochloropsis salina CCMP1776]